jgi:hypothetical protein
MPASGMAAPLWPNAEQRSPMFIQTSERTITKPFWPRHEIELKRLATISLL